MKRRHTNGVVASGMMSTMRSPDATILRPNGPQCRRPLQPGRRGVAVPGAPAAPGAIDQGVAPTGPGTSPRDTTAGLAMVAIPQAVIQFHYLMVGCPPLPSLKDSLDKRLYARLLNSLGQFRQYFVLPWIGIAADRNCSGNNPRSACLGVFAAAHQS